MVFLLCLICLCAYGFLEGCDEEAPLLHQRAFSQSFLPHAKKKNLLSLLQTHEYFSVRGVPPELRWRESQSFFPDAQRKSLLSIFPISIDCRDGQGSLSLAQKVASTLEPMMPSDVPDQKLRSGQYNKHINLRTIYDACLRLIKDYQTFLRGNLALDQYYIKNQCGNALCSLLSALKGFCMRDQEWTEAAFRTHSTWLSSDGAYGCDPRPIFFSFLIEWEQSQKLLNPIREQMQKSLLPCLQGACILVPIDELEEVHQMMQDVTATLDAIVSASPNILAMDRQKSIVLSIQNGKYGDFCFYADSHLDLETFVASFARLELEYNSLLYLENYKKVSIVESYYLKKEYQQACDKLVIALEYFCQRDRERSDKEFCCFLKHLSAIQRPLTPQLWCEKAQELLDPYRGVLTLPAASLDTNDLDQLRGLAEPILATLKRAQDETYHGSDEAVMPMVCDAFHRPENKFEKYKEDALRASIDGNFNCDMETFFYLFSALKEECDALSSLDIEKKGIIRLCYIKQKLIDAHRHLFEALNIFCAGFLSYDKKDLIGVIQATQCFWGKIVEVRSAYIRNISLEMLQKEVFKPFDECCRESRILMIPYRDHLLGRLTQDYFAISDLDQLRGFAEPILTTLQEFHIKNYHASAEAVIARKAFVLEESRCGRGFFDMEGFFYIFSELKERCSDLLALDSREVRVTDLSFCKTKYINAHHKLFSAFKRFCIHIEDDEEDDRRSCMKRVNRDIRAFWIDMKEVEVTLYVQEAWKKSQELLDDLSRAQILESLLSCSNGACVLMKTDELQKMQQVMQEVTEALKPIVHPHHENIPSTARKKSILRGLKNGEYNDSPRKLQTFFDVLCALLEEYNALLLLANKRDVSIAESYYRKREHKQSCEKLLLALEYFCQRDRESCDKEFSSFLNHISSRHKPLPFDLHSVARVLFLPYRVLLTPPAYCWKANDLGQLRGLAEPILATLQQAQAATYHGSAKEMMERKKFFLEVPVFAHFNCDMETFFYLFSILDEEYDSLLSLDIAEKGITHLCYIKQKFIYAYGNLLKALNIFCQSSHIFDESFYNVKIFTPVIQHMKSCWEEMAQAYSHNSFDRRLCVLNALDEWWGITKRLMNPCRDNLLQRLSEDFFEINDLDQLRVFVQPTFTILQDFHTQNYHGSAEAMIERKKVVLEISKRYSACFDMESFFYLFSELEERCSGLLDLDSSKVSGADLCFVKTKCRNAYHKLLSALKCLCTHIQDDNRGDRLSTIDQLEQDISDFWIHMKSAKMPLKFYERCEAAQELLGDANREELLSEFSTEDYRAIKDPYALRTFAEPILTTLKRVHSETYHGSAGEMMERKKFFLKQAADDKFHADVDTFFYIFSELAEKYDSCSKKGTIHCFDIKEKYIDTSHSLLLALSNFCKHKDCCAVKDLKSCWKSIAELCRPISDYERVYIDDVRLRMYKKKCDVKGFCSAPSAQFFDIRDLKQLRGCAQPILDDLQAFHSEIYRASSEEMMARKELIIKAALACKAHIDLETYFYTFSYFDEESARFSSSPDCKWIEAYRHLLSSFQCYLLGKDVAKSRYDAAWWLLTMKRYS